MVKNRSALRTRQHQKILTKYVVIGMYVPVLILIYISKARYISKDTLLLKYYSNNSK